MAQLTLQDIRDAQTRIRPIVEASPVKESFFLEKRTGVRTFLKLENMNLSGSFKIRGACNAVRKMSAAELQKGIVAASAGNHAQAVAWATRMVGARATIYMPERTPLVKAEGTRELGADVRLGGDSYDDAFQAATTHVEREGGILLHAFSNLDVIAGQGTMGLELLTQIADLKLVLVAIGGGGMASGVACALKELKPDITVIGVQCEAFPAMSRSFAGKTLISCAAGRTIADGIAVKTPTALTHELISKYLDDVVTVDEDAIASSVMDLMERDHTLAEGAGAVSVAALHKLPGQRLAAIGKGAVACVVSGGNIDVNLLSRIIPNGMKYSGRFMRIQCRIPDRPGRLADLLNLLGKTGANLLDVHHNRLLGSIGFEDVEVLMDLETIDAKHQDVIRETLSRSKFKFSVLG